MRTERSTQTQQDAQKDAMMLSALLQIHGFGNQTILRLLQKAGSPQSLWNAPDSFWEQSIPASQKDAILRKIDEGYDPERFLTYEKLGIQVIAFTDPQYPTLLKEIHNPPLVLHVKGNLSALHEKTISIVGTRMASDYGKKVTEKLVEELAGIQPAIVSGLAAGIDTCAHWAALKHQLPTIAVFGCGLDIIFPRTNQALSEGIVAHGGALVSEYPLTTPGSKFTYPQRNRIVAGLSQGVIVVEGSMKSGALITARLALEEGRSVYAVPGNIFSPGSQGPLHLIKSGAIPISQGQEILYDLGWIEGEHPDQSLRLEPGLVPKSHHISQTQLPLLDIAEEDQKLIEKIPYDPMAIDLLQPKTGLSSAQLGEKLTLLELDGYIMLLPGANVCRK